MQIKIETGFYNDRRYGRPWIAIVDFSSSKQGDFKFGEFVGDDKSGRLFVVCEPGDIIAQGQNDFRKPKKSSPDYFRAGENGQLEKLSGKAEAYEAWLNKSPSEPQIIDLSQAETAAMIAELERRGIQINK